VPVAELGRPDGMIVEMAAVKASQLAKGNKEVVALMGLILDKIKLVLRIEWERKSLLADVARKNQQYKAYGMEQGTRELVESVAQKLDDDGLEEEAAMLHEKFASVVTSDYRGVIGRRAVSSLKKFAAKTKATVGVPEEYGTALEEASQGTEALFEAHAFWDQLEADKTVWRTLRAYISEKDAIRARLLATGADEASKGMDLHQASVEAWQLSMALYDTGDFDGAEELQRFGLETRARSHSVLEQEMAETKATTVKALARAKAGGADVVQTYLDALASDEARAVKNEMEKVEMAIAGTLVPSVLGKASEELRRQAQALRENFASPAKVLGSDSESEGNELDAGDIDTLDDLAETIDEAREAWEFELAQLATISQVREDHFRKAFGPRPASRAETPAWPLQPWPEKPDDPIGDQARDEVGSESD